jgi:hypothetical protein
MAAMETSAVLASGAHLLSDSVASSRMRLAIPRESPYHQDPNPIRVNDPVPVGWQGHLLQDATNAYERHTSDERLRAASQHAHVADAPMTGMRESSEWEPHSIAIVDSRRRVAALRTEGERLAALLGELPPMRPGQHIDHRSLPTIHDCFARHRHQRTKGMLTVHRNLCVCAGSPRRVTARVSPHACHRAPEDPTASTRAQPAHSCSAMRALLHSLTHITRPSASAAAARARVAWRVREQRTDVVRAFLCV